MDIDKAIKELEEYNGATFEARFITFSQALQLGIEALEAIKEYRRLPFYSSLKLLPGETED